MFGFGLKYRSEVIVEIHAILKLVPKLGSLLNTIPTLKGAIKKGRANSLLQPRFKGMRHYNEEWPPWDRVPSPADGKLAHKFINRNCQR